MSVNRPFIGERSFAGNERGNVALLFAIVAPLLLAFVGAGVDYGRYYQTRAALQNIADKSALIGARQYAITQPGASLPSVIAKQEADNGIGDEPIVAGAIASATDDSTNASVTVSLTHSFKPTLFVSMFKSPIDLAVDATAQSLGSANICVIALETGSDRALLLQKDARLTGANCAIYSNSVGVNSLVSKDRALLSSVLNCTSGGYDGDLSNYSPAPLTDCPQKENPLTDRVGPTVGACDHNKLQIDDAMQTLFPGVYCGGLSIKGNSKVVFSPGTYVIKDGVFLVDDTSSIEGVNVGFYFMGKAAKMKFTRDTSVSLTAPTTGQMAGLLILEDDSGNEGARVFEVSSNDAKTLVGTVYLPKGRFYAAAQEEVAAESAYTAIIARRIELDSSVNLVLNSNYKATDVPVPVGIGGGVAEVFLRD